VISAHLIPGFTPKPAPATAAPTLGWKPTPDASDPPCLSAGCMEVIDE
jgi:hypothetical protein